MDETLEAARKRRGLSEGMLQEESGDEESVTLGFRIYSQGRREMRVVCLSPNDTIGQCIKDIKRIFDMNNVTDRPPYSKLFHPLNQNLHFYSPAGEGEEATNKSDVEPPKEPARPHSPLKWSRRAKKDKIEHNPQSETQGLWSSEGSEQAGDTGGWCGAKSGNIFENGKKKGSESPRDSPRKVSEVPVSQYENERKLCYDTGNRIKGWARSKAANTIASMPLSVPKVSICDDVHQMVTELFSS